MHVLPLRLEQTSLATGFLHKTTQRTLATSNMVPVLMPFLHAMQSGIHPALSPRYLRKAGCVWLERKRL